MQLNLDLCQDLDFEYFLGIYDKDEINFLLEQRDDDSIFVDVGANQGFYSLCVSKKVMNSRVLAIEPDPYHVCKFQKNILLNKVSNITLCQYALSDTNEERELMINTGGNRAGNSLLLSQTSFTGKQEECINVSCKTLLDALRENNIHRVSALKMDIEGYEYPVLNAFFNSAPRGMYPKAVVVEAFGHTIKPAGGSPIELLISKGYKLVNHKNYNFFFLLA